MFSNPLNNVLADIEMTLINGISLKCNSVSISIKLKPNLNLNTDHGSHRHFYFQGHFNTILGCFHKFKDYLRIFFKIVFQLLFINYQELKDLSGSVGTIIHDRDRQTDRQRKNK